MDKNYHKYQTDATLLLSHLSDKRPEALDYILDHYGKSVYFFSNSILNDAQMSEDVLQDTFIRLWKQNVKFPNIGSLRSYLYQTSKNLCLDNIKYSQVREKHAFAAAEALSENALEEKIIEEEMIGEIYRAVENLPQDSKKIFKLYLEGKSNIEIAEIFSISVNTVKTQKYRAFKILRKKLSRRSFLLLLTGLHF